jgi:hypothetical protein
LRKPRGAKGTICKIAVEQPDEKIRKLYTVGQGHTVIFTIPKQWTEIFKTGTYVRLNLNRAEKQIILTQYQEPGMGLADALDKLKKHIVGGN